MICWKCKESIQSPVCVGCGTIQPPPPNPDYFTIFGLSRVYFIPELSTKYRMLSRQLHPDRFVSKTAVERRMSLLWTATINEAKRCLEDPIARARYIATGSAHPKEDKKIILSTEFLEHIFDLQMMAMEHPAEVQEQARRECDHEFSLLHDIFTQWEKDGDDTRLQEVDMVLARIKYLENLTQPKG